MSTGVITGLPRHCENAAVKFYHLQGCVFKILVYVSHNSVSLHQVKKNCTYIPLESQEYWEHKRTLPWICTMEEKTQETSCSSFDFSWGYRTSDEARMIFTRCFKGRTVSRCPSWTDALHSDLGDQMTLSLGEVRWALWVSRHHLRITGTLQCLAGIVLLFMAFGTCQKTTNYSVFPLRVCSPACLLICNVFS